MDNKIDKKICEIQVNMRKNQLVVAKKSTCSCKKYQEFKKDAEVTFQFLLAFHGKSIFRNCFPGITVV